VLDDYGTSRDAEAKVTRRLCGAEPMLGIALREAAARCRQLQCF